MKNLFYVLLPVVLIVPCACYGQSLAKTPHISFTNGAGYFAVSTNGESTTLYTTDAEFPGVTLAVKSLQNDIKSVTNSSPATINKIGAEKQLIIIGTIGKNGLIDKMIKRGKIDAGSIIGKWEAHITQVVDNPIPGVKKALVIVGSDKRGTIYGIYDLSAQMGVSPWYWWADVPIPHHDNLYITPGKCIEKGPAVKYRGIFINDEAPAFSGWAKEKFGGVNHLVYEKMFELILRLKGNYLWPAMWGNAFNDDDKLNPVLADKYGIVMGTSHHEPMDRAQQEWKRYGVGAWNYETNGAVLRDFWRKGIENMGSKETIVTVGMRGDGDMPMTEGSNIALLEKIVKDQRQIIASVTGKDAAQTPQMWALYKEVQAYYDKGMRVPDDVTLLLCDDNWGNIRKLPRSGGPARKGGYGIYYHFDYVGDPRNYKWVNTNQISKTWEQMHLAYEYNARQVWIVNVGDLKPMEFPISFFLDYAWSPDKWPVTSLDKYTEQWAAQQFGTVHAAEIAHVLNLYTKFNSRRKPELLNDSTYSLVNYNEFENVVKGYENLRAAATRLRAKLPPQFKDAYYQLVLHPVEACANLYEMYYYTAKNKAYATQQRAATNAMADSVRKCYERDSLISDYYNKVMANGKWNHMMDQTHIGYTYWQQPAHNKLPDLKTIQLPAAAPQMGVSIDGTELGQSKQSLAFFQGEKRKHYIEIFNKGQGSFGYKVLLKADYITIGPANGNIIDEQRLWVNVDWIKAPKGISKVPVVIDGNSQKVALEVLINKTLPANASGFYEENGVVSIEAEHYTKVVGNKNVAWTIIPGYGRTLSGVMPAPVTAKSQIPGGNGPHLEYTINLSDTGRVEFEAYISPAIDFTNTHGLRYAISIDNEQPQVININADQSPQAWSIDVSNNIKKLTSTHRISKTGRHVLKYWMVDPGVVLQKLVINCGGEKPSYLGPPESFYRVTK
ncbi:glycosyl hydrolase 115 family protein [Mucilaginibacter flavidus]|uniref:glycosyl hydrolase 115 family protein n=1 Tax=Mucilaginibacter flavidus TaxID=2949309 RepID=UPI0020928407|nr:glycosyl hydrolase 115 family protein [Mucilaginibacter flavidus]MCO5947521.1 glycosyl hydrolase 115 family protein [Mucilaginibacter flavidus]